MPDTVVNPQITDAVTQANVKVLGEAPAMAMGSIYQSVSHALALLYQDAVTGQQQLQITAQAALTQGVMLLYSLDTASDAGPQRVESAMNDTAQALNDAAATKNAQLAGEVSGQVKDAVNFAQDKVLGAIGDFAYGQRACSDAFVAALVQVGAAQHKQRMQVLQEAASAVCLSAMLKSPEQAEAYAELLERIKRLV